MTYDDLKALHPRPPTLRFLGTADAKKCGLVLYNVSCTPSNSVGHSKYSKYHVTICDNQVLLLLNPSNHCSPMSYDPHMV